NGAGRYGGPAVPNFAGLALPPAEVPLARSAVDFLQEGAVVSCWNPKGAGHGREQGRAAARNPRLDGAEDAGDAGAAARLRHCAAAGAGERPTAGDEPGHALPGAASDRAARLDPLVLGSEREQPARPLLLAHRQ